MYKKSLTQNNSCITFVLEGVFAQRLVDYRRTVSGLSLIHMGLVVCCLKKFYSLVFLVLDLHFKVKPSILFDLQISRNWLEIEQTLLLLRNRMSCIFHHVTIACKLCAP